MPPVPPKMLILEFELEQKMNHHFRIEFHDESDGNSLKAQKLNHDTLIALDFRSDLRYYRMNAQGIIYLCCARLKSPDVKRLAHLCLGPNDIFLPSSS